jgi:hypothetical protein
MAEVWKKCTECRNDIAFGAAYYQCSVSTCNRTRFPLVFCSVVCWDSHLSSVRHRDAGAIEAKAPSKAEWEREQAADNEKPTQPSRPPTSPGVVSQPGAAKPSSPAIQGGTVQPVRIRADDTRPNLVPPMPATVELQEVTDNEILIVVSKLKKYIKDRSGFNTSDQIIDLLSEHVRAICDEAIRTAARDDRKTVLERDVPRPRR